MSRKTRALRTAASNLRRFRIMDASCCKACSLASSKAQTDSRRKPSKARPESSPKSTFQTDGRRRERERPIPRRDSVRKARFGDSPRNTGICRLSMSVLPREGLLSVCVLRNKNGWKCPEKNLWNEANRIGVKARSSRMSIVCSPGCRGTAPAKKPT